MKPLVRDIARQVAQEYRVPLRVLLGRGECAAFSRVRVEAWRRARLAGRSSREIARVFDNRDPSTIRRAVRKDGR